MSNIEFKRQTPRSTRQDTTDNIHLYFKDFSFGIVTSKGWGDFSETNKVNPVVEIDLEGRSYRIYLNDFKKKLKEVLNPEELENWWKLETSEINDIDRQHIAEQIKQGYTQGEIIHEEEDFDEDGKLKEVEIGI